MPGVPDFYQGTELWDFSLVDPDNRRPVDFSARAKAIEETAADWPTLAKHWQNGQIKLALTHALLRLRKENSVVVQNGTFIPLRVAGVHAAHVIAYKRVHKRTELVLIAARRFAPLTDGGRHWPTKFDAVVRIASNAAFNNAFNSAQSPIRDDLQVADLFRDVPVAVLRNS
jgi:(1->4)-alpha-D-glucan 1-alpha-D-glucosylmutase